MLSGHSIVTVGNSVLIKVSEIGLKKLDFNPHLYFILGMPRWYFKKVKLSKNKVKFELMSEDGTEYKNYFSLEKNGESKKIDSVEISKDNLSITINGNERYSSTDLMLNNQNFIPAFKILYIGQAKGSNLSRNAQDRLSSHSTLQKVLADINDSKLEYDVRLLLFSTREDKIATTLDSGKYATIQVDEILNFPDDNNHINLIEAKLINYFKPEYNKKFKENYVPSMNHSSYIKYYEQKYNSMIISLLNIGLCSFFTNEVEEFNSLQDRIDYSILGEDNFYESLIKPFFNKE
ncbi:type I restriction endonuclease subunit S [Streptococcus pluranimalium]|uniref:type I restriction endonuclease subunit S n=1 Tax=Streptococcus pluranimalium TaxID=82348 RepID=UPI00313A2E3A